MSFTPDKARMYQSDARIEYVGCRKSDYVTTKPGRPLAILGKVVKCVEDRVQYTNVDGHYVWADRVNVSIRTSMGGKRKSIRRKSTRRKSTRRK